MNKSKIIKYLENEKFLQEQKLKELLNQESKESNYFDLIADYEKSILDFELSIDLVNNNISSEVSASKKFDISRLAVENLGVAHLPLLFSSIFYYLSYDSIGIVLMVMGGVYVFSVYVYWIYAYIIYKTNYFKFSRLFPNWLR